METALLAGPGRAGPGLAMPRVETGRGLNPNSGPRAGPDRAVRSTGRAGPGRADKIRPVQISGVAGLFICAVQACTAEARTSDELSRPVNGRSVIRLFDRSVGRSNNRSVSDRSFGGQSVVVVR